MFSITKFLYSVYCYLLINYSLLNPKFNKPLTQYITNSAPFQTLLSFGNYTLIAILLLVILSIFSKKLRILIVSIIMAMIALFLVIIIYEIAQDLEVVTTI